MADQAKRIHVIFKVKEPGRTRIVVLDTQDLTLGRAPENDLAIDEPEMSRQHAIIKRTATGCRVEDMGTSNGTLVNGESVDHADLAHGDVIKIGEVEITYALTPRNPASLGPSVEYASQLKSFASPMAGQASDNESTILGLMDTAGDADEEFSVQAAGDFDLELNAERPPGTRTRNLDAEVADLDDGLGEVESAESLPQVPTPVVEAESEPDPVWELEEDDVAPDLRADASQAPGRLTLTLEIEGAQGELRTMLAGLAGKVLDLSGLKVRIKPEDLG